jgi:uncharacterized membrane protein
MRTTRLEAFSDGVLAIVITIMVLNLRAPDKPTVSALANSGAGLLAYLLSFVYIGIYWSNHHHMFQLVRKVDGAILWANLGLLFFLSLVPFSTQWMDNTTWTPTYRGAGLPVTIYGVNLLAAAIAYYVLQRVIFRAEGPDSLLQQALGRDLKGKLSPLIYAVGIGGSFLSIWIGVAAYVVVALIWLVPDRRAERFINAHLVEQD